MKILTIDVTSPKLLVAAYDGNKIVSKVSTESGKKHNSLVIPYVDSVLNELNLTLNDIDVFSCVVGPGSFTGIRIGIATIKAFSFATNKKCVAINALEEEAYSKEGNFYVTLDALHGNCYGAKFEGSWKNISDVGCYSYDKVKESGLASFEKKEVSDPSNLINITLEKAKDGNYSILEPLYLRKSQAERDLDGE